MSYGLSEKQHSTLIRILRNQLRQGIVILYGSRAKETFTERSDIDLVIRDAGTTDHRILAAILDEIDESDLPFLVDICFYETISNPSLREHIDRAGKTIFQA